MKSLRDTSFAAKSVLITLTTTVISAGAWYFLEAFFSTAQTGVVGVDFVLKNSFLSAQFTILISISLMLLALQVAFFFPKKFKANSTLSRVIAFDFDDSYLLRLVIFALQIQAVWFFVDSRLSLLSCVLALSALSISLFLLLRLSGSAKANVAQSSKWLVVGSVLYIYFALKVESTSNIKQSVFNYVLIWLIFVFILFVLCHFVQTIFFKDSSINFLNTAALFLFVQVFLPRAQQMRIHSFESAPFANAALTLSGSLPWRDYLLEHGVWEDSLRLLIPYRLFSYDIVSVAQFLELVIRPFEIFILIWSISMIFRSNLLSVSLLILFSAIEVLIPPSSTGFSIFPSPRNLLLWPLTLFLVQYCRRPSSGCSAGIGILTGIYFLSSPEAIYAIVGVFASLFLVAFQLRQWKIRFLHTFIWLFSCTATLVFFLQLYGLIPFFFEDLRISGSGYFTAWGALPNIGNSIKFDFFFFLTHILLTCLLIVAFRVFFAEIPNIRQRSNQLFGITPLLITSVAYYVKFLRWPDWHLLQPLSLITVSLLFLMFLNQANNFESVKNSVEPSGIYFVILTLITSFFLIVHFRATEVLINSTYTRDSEVVLSEARKIASFESNTSILDFGNEPFTWYSAGYFKPSGGISKTMNILTVSSQKLALARIQKDMPKIVVLGSGWGYWSTPFQNWAAKYEISKFILENYRPFKVVGSYMLMVPGDVLEAPPSQLRWLTQLPCDYGKLPGSYRLDSSNAQSFSSIKQTTKENVVFPHNAKAFAFRTNQDAEVELINTTNGGHIRFNLLADGKASVVPVFGCPSWILRNKNDQWKLLINSQTNVKIEIYSLVDSRYEK